MHTVVVGNFKVYFTVYLIVQGVSHAYRDRSQSLDLSFTIDSLLEFLLDY